MGKLVLGFCSVNRLNQWSHFPLGFLHYREAEAMTFILKKSFPCKDISNIPI